MICDNNVFFLIQTRHDQGFPFLLGSCPQIYIDFCTIVNPSQANNDNKDSSYCTYVLMKIRRKFIPQKSEQQFLRLNFFSFLFFSFGVGGEGVKLQILGPYKRDQKNNQKYNGPSFSFLNFFFNFQKRQGEVKLLLTS